MTDGENRGDIDPIAGVLSSLRVRAVACARMELGEPWAVDVPPVEALQLHLLVEGSVWFEDGRGDRQVFDAGAAWSIPSGHRYRIGAGEPARVLSLAEALTGMPAGYTRDAGGRGPRATLICVQCDLGPRAIDPLTGCLPPHLGARTMSPTLARLVPVLDRAIVEGGPGVDAVTTRVAELCLVEFLRAWLASPERAEETSWIGALSHPGLGRALGVMMASPDAAHDVASLARVAAMSRSGFSETFHARMGRPPLAWLRRFRVQRAALRLFDGEPVDRVAASVGFASPSAFSRAFVRELGARPRAWARSKG